MQNHDELKGTQESPSLAELEVLYLETIILLATEQTRELAKKNSALAFDPQGSVMVALNKKSIEEKLRTKYPNTDFSTFLSDKTNTTIISLDITKIDDINQKFIEISAKNSEEDQVKRQNELPKGSINPIYREFYFHLNAAKRIVLKLTEDKYPRPLNEGQEAILEESKKNIEAAFQASLLQVNSRIMDHYQKSFNGISLLGTEDIAEINKKLASTRKELLDIAHSTFKDELQKGGISLNEKEIKKVKKLSKTTTATENDIVYAGSNQVMWAAGNNSSSHDRQWTEKGATEANFGCQRYANHTYDPKTGKVVANINERLQIRAPSLAMKRKWDPLYYFKGKTAVDEPFIQDVANKLAALKTEKKLSTDWPDDKGKSKKPKKLEKPKAIVYNLFTALNRNRPNELYDEFNNKQSQSAEYILKGAHRYNQEQLVSGFPQTNPMKADGVFCLVQNISVNGFGHPLRYGSGIPLVEEATLMTDMALLHTLWEQSPVTNVNIEDTRASQAFGQYRKFLNKENREDYFSQSAEGKEALKFIKLFQAGNAREHSTEDTHHSAPDTDPIASAKNSLYNLMRVNAHHINNASLFQALSVFVEKGSVDGCKSAIDRTPMVNARVNMLDRAFNDPEPREPDIQVLRKALDTLGKAKPSDDILSASKALESVMNKALNNHGLETGASMQTQAEIGGAAKYNAKKGTWRDLFDTNNAETAEMTNVAHEGATQTHKTFDKAFTKAWGATTRSNESPAPVVDVKPKEKAGADSETQQTTLKRENRFTTGERSSAAKNTNQSTSSQTMGNKQIKEKISQLKELDNIYQAINKLKSSDAQLTTLLKLINDLSIDAANKGNPTAEKSRMALNALLCVIKPLIPEDKNKFKEQDFIPNLSSVKDRLTAALNNIEPEISRPFLTAASENSYNGLVHEV